MKKSLLVQFLFASFLFFGLFTSHSASAQTYDTLLFDYDAYVGCNACNDRIMANVGGTKDSFVDNTSGSMYLYELKVKIKLFTCLSAAPLILKLNGQTVGTYSSNYFCSCNACDSVTYVISSNDLRLYYKYGKTNTISLSTTGSSGLYIDRSIVYSVRVKKFNYDAGILSVDSPSVYSCAGTKNIVVKINNNGKKQFTGVDVNWKWNGVTQTTASYSGTLDTLNGTGNNTAQVKLGSKTFSIGKSDTLIAWTKNPGSITDSLNFNDTIKTIFRGSYSDTLTVGGSSPTFSTITDAVNALMTNGICSNTFVKIRPGTYNEQVTIGNIPGTEFNNKVTFLSSNNDSSSVIINFSSNSSNNYTVNLNNGKNVTFSKVTIEALNTSYATAVLLTGSVENIAFKNCALIGKNTTSTSSILYTVYRRYSSGTEKTNNITFDKCRISNGSAGLYFDNPYNTRAELFSVTNCVIENQYYYNLYLGTAKNVTIQNNTFDRSTSSVEYGYGINLYNVTDSGLIANNIITQRNGAQGGIYLNNCSGSGAQQFRIYNNFISVRTASGYSYYGFYSYYSYYLDVLNNSIYHSNASNSGAYTMYFYEGNSNRFLYNTISSAGAGNAITVLSSGKNIFTKCDRNNYYNGGNKLGSFFNTTISSIADIKALGYDSNSVSVNPNFKSFTDLHAYNVDLDGRARPEARVKKDIDGETRNSSTPDIGADEFKLAGKDAGISDLIKPTVGTQCMRVVIKNSGNNTLTSAKIDWKINGSTKTQYSWTGSLAKGDTDIVCLGNITFKKDTLYQLKTWTSAPNGGTDSINVNDTLTTQFYPAMRGIYTIGGTSPDFTNFTAAVTALNQAGIIDSVYFKVRNGTYNEQIIINNITGANRFNAITFASENNDSTKVLLQYNSTNSSNNYVIRVNGTNGLTFKGMSIRNFSVTYKRVFEVLNSSKNIRITNNILRNGDSTSSSSRTYLIYFNSNRGSNIKITNNQINCGSFGVYINSDYSFRDDEILISNNVFRKQGYYGMYLYYPHNMDISKNDFLETGTSLYSSVYIYNPDGRANFNNNKVVTTSSNAYYSVYLDNYYSNFDTFKVYNNFISLSNNLTGYAISTNYLEPAYLANNNILNECTDSSSNSAAYYVYGGYITVRNNNFAHTGHGYAMYNSYNYGFSSDNNNYYTNGTKFIYYNYTDYANLPDFISNEGLDTAGVSTDPIYTSSSDLHAASINLNAAALPISFVTVDYDGESRGSTPDIGADEFTPVTTDAGVSKLIYPGQTIKADTADILVAVSNYGIDTLQSVVVHFKVNNDTLARKSISRTFASGDTIIVNMGSFIFRKDSVYNFTSWTSLPNGGTDGKPSNDTLKVLNRRTAMSGVYTIGGTTPNFTTFKAAVNALKLAGIADSVRFRVRQGTYTEQISIPSINGAGARNSIIFESEDLDTSKVTLQFASTKSDTNWVVQLLGADGITFRYLRVKSYSSNNYNVVFDIRNRADYNTLFANNIEGPNISYGSSDNALIRAQQDANNYFQILNNQLKYGDYAFYLSGSASTTPFTNAVGLEIRNNRISNPFYYHGYVYSHQQAEITGNICYSDKYQYSYGLYFENLRNFDVSNNQVFMPKGYLGIYFYNCGNSSSGRNLVSNNSIIISNNSNNSYGLYAYYLYNSDVLHNTVRVNNSTYTSYALYQYYGSKNILFNNIFANTGIGYSLYLATSTSIDSSNYNDIYAASSTLAYINSSTYSNLTDLYNALGWEKRGLNINPLFLGVKNNHVKEVTLNGAAKYFARVAYDMDYETRDTIKPDIGADEFILPPNDAGIFKIITPNKPFQSDTQQVKVVLKNYGGNPLYLVDIGWKFNGVSQTKVTWSDTLGTGDTIHINLGKRFFHPDSAYSLKVWTSKPNGTGDSINTNDTIQSIKQYPALSGIYTIGGSAPDFNTFNDAVTAMKRGGIIDSVRFDVRNGTYFEQLIIPYIFGAKNTSSIIFQSEQRDSSKVTLIGATSSSANYVVRMDSLWGATFRFMSFQTSKTNYYNTIFQVLNGSGNIKIHDCNLISKTTSTGNEESIIYCYNNNSSKPTNRNIEVYNNRFINGAYGFFEGYGYSSFGNSRDYNIHHNVFEDQYYTAIYLYYTNNFKVNYNQIYHKNAQNANSYGILAQYNNEGFEIVGNNIYDQEYYGIYLYNAVGAVNDTCLIANNFIHCRTNNSVFAAIIYYPNYLNLVNNNFHVNSSSTSSYGCYVYSPSRTFSYNNNFVNTGSGYAMYIQGNFNQSNFNNYFTGGSNLFNRSGTNYSNLGGWQTATGQDGKSLNTNPDYIANNDLHVRNTDLNGKAKRIPYLIKKDYDGELRDSVASDIGADEFKIPAANDAGISAYIGPIAPFKSGVNNVKVYIKNYGSDSLKSATIRWRVNGVIQSNKSWTGKLKTGQTDTITIGTYNFLNGKKHDLQFWTISPNGVSDTINYNDSFTKRNIYPALKGIYTVEGSLPDFNTLGDAFSALKLGGAIDSVWFKIRTGTYNYDLSLGDYPGAHPKRPIFIQSQSGDSSDVVLSPSSYSGQIILLNGADYIKFKKITFESAYYNCVSFNNVSKGIGFENCHFKYPNSYYSGTSIYSNSDKDDSTTVQGCRFDNGVYGVFLYGYNATEYEKNAVISKCVFNNQYYYAIYLDYSENATIKQNTITNSISSSPLIYISSPKNALTISYNKVTSTSGYGTCLSLYNHSGSSGKKANIYNNFFSSSSNGYSQYIVQVSTANFLNFYYNSINVYGTGNPIALYAQSVNNFDFRNNIVSNPAGGRALYFNSNSLTQANYNDLYTSGTTFGYFNSTDYNTLSSWKSATSRETNSLSLDPNYTSNTDLHSNLASLDSACLPISGFTDDIDFEARNTSRADIGADEFQSLPDNLGVSAFVTPATSCGLDSITVKVKIFNYGNKPQVNFPVRYQIDAGSIISATITDTIKPGKELQYQFSKRVAVVLNTNYKIAGWTDLSNEKYRKNDSTRTTFTNFSVPDTVKSMVPANNTSGLDFPISLSWLPATGATKYDLYYWKSSASKPSSPNASNITQISYQIGSGLTYGETYNWQIVSRNPVCSTPGLVKSFSMRYLPDLTVSEVNAPSSAFSGTTISISWKIKNNGAGSASGTWYDAIYMSSDAILDVTDRYLGAVTNPSGLSSSQTYSQSATITLPNGVIGNYYVFVSSDYYSQITEVDNDNNNARDTGKMVIKLTPPPDLQVISVTRPSTVFSGSSANLTFVVKNKGTGPTRSGGWNDRIFLSSDKTVNSGSRYLTAYHHSGNLLVDSSYSVNASVTIPNFISGRYYFVVETDYVNEEFEYASESNNVTGSDSMKVILTPPPDLIVENVAIADTVSSDDIVNFKYEVHNDGGTATGSGFYDLLFFCPTSTFSPTLSTYVTTNYNPNLGSKDTSHVSINTRVPKLNGTYYLFVLTDYYNHVNEPGKENNNISSPFKVVIQSPDLVVSRVSVASKDTTSTTTKIGWTVKNQGKGADRIGNRTDSLYISKSATWNRNNATKLGALRYTVNLAKGDTAGKSAIVTIPDGFDGNRYFYVVADAANEVYEAGRDTNNYKRSNLMNIILGPYPDLFPSLTSFPDSAKAGDLIGIGYSVKNKGKNKANPNWKDRFYFSKDSVFNPTKAIVLSSVTKSSILEVDSTYSAIVYMNLPSSIARGNYYYFVFTDFEKTVYEHFNDSNNLIRSKKVFINGYPPVDLKVNCPSVVDTMWSGKTYTVSYSVKNIGEAKTPVGSWNDGIYISLDTILTPSDPLIKQVFINSPLAKDSTYNISTSISIPNGISGNYYLIVRADMDKLISDVDTTNNKKSACKTTGGAKLKRINLTPPPDLQITSWSVPSIATSGQPIKISWNVENKGSGATLSGAWKDQFFLSTDYTIDINDILLSEKQHNGNLAVNGSYKDSVNANIPINKVGNFIVLLKTDAANVEYEHSNESNNTVSSITTASQAPPADLIVSSISSPDSVISGHNITVTWKIKNNGSNPATGGMYDNVYLSKDKIQDGSDLLLTSVYHPLTLAPTSQSTLSRSLNVSGLELGDYYVLVATDVLNNIYESNDTNNTATAINLLNVTIPVLPLNVKTPDTLNDNEEIYHRIVIPNSLAGESLLITLKGDSVNGDNQIFVKFNTIASGSDFDFKYREPFAGNQEIIIPELLEGTYYLMTTGKTSVGNKQNITLFARILPFEIRKVTPSQGGNTGDVTVLIEGSKFEEGMLFSLNKNGAGMPAVQGDSIADYNYIALEPTSYDFNDPTMIFATFNLAGKDTGYYDLVGIKGTEQTTLVNGFKVVEGIAGDLNVSIFRPGNMRTNNVATMKVLFNNDGNIDLVNQKLIITSTAGAPIGLTEADLKKNLTTLEITVQEDGGPPGRLRPGGNGSVDIYTKAAGAIGFTIIK